MKFFNRIATITKALFSRPLAATPAIEVTHHDLPFMHAPIPSRRARIGGQLGVAGDKLRKRFAKAGNRGPRGY